MRIIHFSVVLAAVLSTAFSTSAAPILAGLSTGPVFVISPTGEQMGVFGAPEAVAAASAGNGTIYTAIPDLSSSEIVVLNSSQAEVRRFSFTPPAGAGTSGFVTDLAWGRDSLWVSTFDGYVYQVSPTGVVLTWFSTAHMGIGVATDGTYVYTTGGDGSPFVYRRDIDSGVVTEFNTGLPETQGIGYDPSDNTLYVGGFFTLTQLNANGEPIRSAALEIGPVTSVEVFTTTNIPEPSTFGLAAVGLLAGFAARKRFRRNLLMCGAMLLAACALPAAAAITINGLTPSVPAPQPAGTPITFTASATDTNVQDLRYRFTVRPSGGANEVFLDYGPWNTFNWTPMGKEGTYEIAVSVRNMSTGEVRALAIPYVVTSRATGGVPVVAATQHPLVALYSAPPCPAGSSMRVRFKRTTDVYWSATQTKTCDGTTSMNYYLAGMYPSTMYDIRHEVSAGPRITAGPLLRFTTGPLPPFVSSRVAPVIPLKYPTSATNGLILFANLNNAAVATDPSGNIVWYDNNFFVTNSQYMTRPAPGGNMFLVFGLGTDLSRSGFHELTLVGDAVKRTTAEALNLQLQPLGKSTNAIHHEVRRLPNGHYLMLGMREKVVPEQGNANVLGDLILELDQDLQLVWVWDAFDKLDLQRKAVLDETCATGAGGGGCVVLNTPRANDWTHSNSVAVTPDGNLVLSARHQDFVYKIDYRNGTGSGNVLWRLGPNGDFTWLTSDPWPWNSHQHDAEYQSPAVMSIYDNSNTRRALFDPAAQSRGMVLQIDETARTVTPLLLKDLGVYAPAVGSAERLSNGNYSFASGFLPPSGNTELLEMDAAGNVVSKMTNVGPTYRIFRLKDIYSAPW